MDGCLKRAQNNLCIQGVNLKESKIFVRDDIDLLTLDRDATIAQSFRSVSRVKEISLEDDDGKDVWDYRFDYSIGIRLIFSQEEKESEEDEFKPVVEIVAAFDARYLSKKQLDEDEMKAFSADNVGYHVWPYWREYVQSSCGRLGLSPAIEVPVYIISRKEAESVKK